MRRVFLPIMLLCGSMVFPLEAAPQSLTTMVDCRATRLTEAEKEICNSPQLAKLNTDIDVLSNRLGMTLSRNDKAVLVDTAGPFTVQRNNCQNERPSVRECIDRILTKRMKALEAALKSPNSLRSEITEYTFFEIPFFLKYGDLLLGKRVNVFGCMVLEPGANPVNRTHGTMFESCSRRNGRAVPAIFRSMDETRAWFFDSKMPSTYWEGTVTRTDGRMVLSQMDP